MKRLCQGLKTKGLSHRAAFFLFTLFAVCGCVQLSPRYLNGPEYERALVLYENGLIIEARDKAEAIGKDDPDYTSSRKLIADINSLTPILAKEHAELGRMYEKAGVFPSAIKAYELSLKFNPVNSPVHKRLQLLYEAARDSEKAEALRSTYRSDARPKKQEKFDPEALADAHYSQGKAYLESGEYSNAIDELNAAVKLLPGYLDAKALLGRAILEKERAIDQHFKKGIRYFQEEEMELAVKEWDAVLELDPDNEKAAEYKARAAAIIERIKSIKEKHNPRPAQ